MQTVKIKVPYKLIDGSGGEIFIEAEVSAIPNARLIKEIGCPEIMPTSPEEETL